MAATVSPWSKPGAWALDAEEHEAELLKQQNDAESASVADFPTLTDAVATKTSKKKKTKGQTLSLAEFATYKPSSEPAGLTLEDRLALPTAPRERSEEEIARSRHGGFRSFDRGGAGGDSRWGSNGRSADRERGIGGRDRDRDREGFRDSGPSRADEADNWAMGKKSSVMNDRRDGGRDRGGGFFDSQSKADESDSWVSSKSYAPPPPSRFDRDRRGSGGGSGGFGLGNGSADAEFWGKKREESNSGVSDAGAMAGGGRPRLNLQPRTLPVATDGGAAALAPAAKPKGANPFGAARPREEVLAEKGQDWKKMDEELEAMKMKEAGERVDGGGFGRRSFGSGNGRPGSSGGRAEPSWRKPGADADADGENNGHDSTSQSAEKTEEVAGEEEN